MTWEDVDINHLDIKDKRVYDEVFKSGNTVGIFQCESVEARTMCIQAQTSEVEDIVVVNAANRPGTKDQFPGYCQNKLNPERTKVVHPKLLEIFKDSHSVMMYQEQALALLRYAGFEETEVDVGRRAIGKKIESVMKTLEPKFKKGLHAKGWTDDQANEMWELLVKQSSYSFNKCLTGDTTVYRSAGCYRDKKYPTHEIPIKEIYDRFNSRTAVGQKYRSGTTTRGLFVECHDKDGRSRKHKIKNIWQQGERPVWKVTLSNGKSVKATGNHRFQVDDYSYKRVDQLKLGDKLWCCDFKYEESNNKYNFTKLSSEDHRSQIRGTTYSGCGFQKGKNNPGYVDGSTMKFNTYRSKKDGVCEQCGGQHDRLETHHIDGDRTNNEPENLENLCVSCHKKKHYRELGRTKIGEKGYPTYCSAITNIEYAGIEMTYDIEIESEEHNFFANGICSHNSHSVAYSLLSYLTAYLKTHHPVEFMTACLINSGDTEKTSQYIVEMDRLGITLGPPDINKSGETFTPDTENKAILYGIKNINNFKTKFYETIISNRPFSNFKEYLQKTIDEVDKTSQIALIKAGAFSKIANSSKKRLIKYYFSIRFDNGKETKKPIKKINKTHIKKLYDSGLITEEQKEDKDYCLKAFNDNRKKEEWKKFSERILSGTELEWEMDTLNTFLSGDPFDGVWLPDWSQVPVGKSGHIGGVITSQKVNVVKKGKSKGQKMAFLNLNTKYGVIDCVCFADKYKDYNQVLSFGKAVVIRATKTGDEKCTLQDAMTLQKYLIKTSRLQGGK